MKGPFSNRASATRSVLMLAVLALVGSGFAASSCVAAFTPDHDRPDSSQTVAGVVDNTDIVSCSNTTGRWMSTLLSQDLAGDVWASQLAEVMAPDAVQGLRGIERESLPDAHVQTVDVVIQGDDCWSTVGLSDGTSVPVHARASGEDWRVAGWGQ